MRVLNERVVHHSFGDIAFPPLTWTLVPADTRSERDGLGPQITKHLGDASDWINYGPDRVLVDLRTICQRFPAIALPLLIKGDDWVELLPQETDGVGAVVVYGRLPA